MSLSNIQNIATENVCQLIQNYVIRSSATFLIETQFLEQILLLMKLIVR